MNEIELDPVDFLTVGTVGPKGRRLFHLQAGQGSTLVTVIIEKEQARALAEAIHEMLDNLNQRLSDLPEDKDAASREDMSLRDPLDPLFRVAQMGLGFDEERGLVLLVVQELLAAPEDMGSEPPEPRTIRMWGTREQMRALSEHTLQIVKQGRSDPKSNGHLIYYWT